MHNKIKRLKLIGRIAFGLSISLGLLSCAHNDSERNDSIQAKLDGFTTFTAQSWASSVDEKLLSEANQVDWLGGFDDPLLVEYVENALGNNRSLIAAAANVERANALAKQAQASSSPQVNLSFSSSRSGSVSGPSQPSTSYNLGVQSQWELDVWDRIGAGERAALLSADAAAADYKYARHSLAAATTKAYFGGIEANLQVQVLQDILSSLEKTLKIVQVQYDNGMASSEDVALTKSDLATTREQLIALKASQRDSLRALEVLLGQYPSADIFVEKEFPKLPGLPAIGVPAEILERRPDIIASERRVAAAFNSVQQAKAARLPQISLTSGAGGTSNSLSNITSGSNVVWQLASNILAPLFDGGLREAAVEAATAEQKQALASYSQAALEAFKEVELNIDLADTLNLRFKELSTALSEAQKAYKISNLKYKEGEIGLIDLLAVQQRVLNAKSNKVAIYRQSLEQRVNLYLALGGDWRVNK